MQDYVPEKQRYSFEQNFSIHPAYPFLISARDMARFGQLFLQQGQWQGRQIIPADWVRDSTRSYSDTGRSWRGYGYLWWTIERDHAGMDEGDYFASGYGGQKVFVLPRINTVVVHRINVYLPGIDVAAASNAPFQLMPKIMQAYTGEKKDVAPILAGRIAPQRRLLPDYTRILAVKERIEARRRVMAWSWLILTAACLVFLVLDLAIGARASWWMRLVCILVTALFGLLGLIVYLISWRQTLRQPELRPSLANWRLALEATLCTMLVYIAAMVLIIVFFVALNFSGTLPSVLIVGYMVPVILALLAVRAPLVVSRFGVTCGLAVRRTLLVEIISVNLALAAAVPAFFFLKFRWFSDLAPDLSSPLFWFMISLVAIAGAVLLYPFHIWMCRRGFGSVLITFRPTEKVDKEQAINTPNLRNVWYVLVISIALLLASIGLMVQNVP
jgi:hypothetical protein